MSAQVVSQKKPNWALGEKKRAEVVLPLCQSMASIYPEYYIHFWFPISENLVVILEKAGRRVKRAIKAFNSFHTMKSQISLPTLSSKKETTEHLWVRSARPWVTWGSKTDQLSASSSTGIWEMWMKLLVGSRFKKPTAWEEMDLWSNPMWPWLCSCEQSSSAQLAICNAGSACWLHMIWGAEAANSMVELSWGNRPFYFQVS